MVVHYINKSLAVFWQFGSFMANECFQIDYTSCALILYFQQVMTQKTVDQKIKDCKELIIQNMEKTIQHKMIYMFLKDRKKEGEVKQFSVNGKDGIIKIEFHEHEKALSFYNDANFNEKILIRPFNIYFNLTLSEGQMKKYYLEGITQENQRKLFEIARKIGICKLYTSYGAGSRAKLKSTGLLSFIRKEDINPEDFNRLTEELKTIGIKINNYIQEKGTKVSLNLINFVSEDLIEKEQNFLHEFAENQARDILQKFTGKVNIGHLSVLVRKKEIIDHKTQQRKGQKLLSSALFEFDNAEETYKYYQKVRIGILEDSHSKVRLFFHNEENNSYLSLITQGLYKKDPKTTDKQFEEELIKSFRQINPNVLQVNIYPVVYNSTFIGRVYLKNEEEGKNFLVDYSNYRSKVYQHYKENIITFNISIDIKTLKKLKQAEKKAKETEDKIKKQTETTRKDNRRPPNQFGLPPNIMVGGAMNPMIPPPMVQPPGMMLPPMGAIGGIPPMGDKVGMMPPPPGMAMFSRPPVDLPPHFAKPMQSMGPMNPAQSSVKYRLNSLLRDKQRFIDMDEISAKRAMIDTMRLYVQELGVANGPQAMRIANVITKEKNVGAIINLLQSQEQYKELAISIKNNQH